MRNKVYKNIRIFRIFWWELITILQFKKFCGVGKIGRLVPHFQSPLIFRSSFFDAVTR